MICSRCGTHLAERTGVCSRCGAALGTHVAAGVLTPLPLGNVSTTPGEKTVGYGDASTGFETAAYGDPEAQTGIGSNPVPHGEMLLVPGQAFGRYHIIRLLGIGGMGAVYHAWDAELGVAVAVKVIKPEVTADRVAAQEMERRFKRELLLARQVTHKNVVRI